jgi:hypothetical protein
LNALITQTYRSTAYQSELYAQGRTKPGSIVTDCKGGTSPHEFRYAFDICKNVKGHEYDDSDFFKKCGKVWQDMGGEWGGSWKAPDMPHFQFGAGFTDLQLRTGVKIPNDARMPWEEVKKVTQEEFNAMMAEWLRQQREKPVSDWAETAWSWGRGTGICDGTSPQGLITRQEVVQMLFNYHEMLANNFRMVGHE